MVTGHPGNYGLGRVGPKESVGKGFFKEVLDCVSCRMNQDLVGDRGTWGIPGQEQEKEGKPRGVELELRPGSWESLITCFLLEPEVGT